MTPPPSAVTSIRWSAVFPWLLLVRGARLALMVRVLVLAIAGVLITQGGWRLLDDAPPDDAATSWLTDNAGVGSPAGSKPLLNNYLVLRDVRTTVAGGPLYRGWRWASEPFIKLPAARAWSDWRRLGLAGVWGVAVWALFGGAIARIAAVHLTYGETLGPIAALRAALQKWLTIVGAPTLTAIALVMLALPLWLAGFLLRVDGIALLIGLAWCLILLGGLAIAIVAVGLAFGWPLMWSTVAVERTDAFDAISRAFAYLYQRPLHLLFYIFVASLLGIVAQAAVELGVNATVAATYWAVGFGAGDERMAELGLHGPFASANLGTAGQTAGEAIRWWTWLLRLAATSFPMAYLWPAATAIYLLLRREIDGTEMTEVAFDEGDPKRGLPILAPDAATGVPQVVKREGEVAPRATPPADA